MEKKCEHGKRKCFCKECGGNQFCTHNKRKDYCKECGGSQICKHNKRKDMCKECAGSQFCEHTRLKCDCKVCGTNTKFLRGGFMINQVKEIGKVKICQFPNCLIQAHHKPLHSDHCHDGNELNTENYRGEICRGHNLLLADLDAHPEDANEEARKYMNRRPYKRNIMYL
jgi:hypothetical protein